MSSKLWEIKVQESHQSSDSVFMMGKVFIKFEKNLFYWLYKLKHLELKTVQRKLKFDIYSVLYYHFSFLTKSWLKWYYES